MRRILGITCHLRTKSLYCEPVIREDSSELKIDTLLSIVACSDAENGGCDSVLAEYDTSHEEGGGERRGHAFL